MDPAAINMRHNKLKASEAALLAGELVKPTWASRNEGIHERISFEDTLWGFEMAGGAYYKTPLRVAYVRPGSRAERACIRMGDTVLRINGQDTSNLTLQEAHKLVLEAGINLKIVVTSPEDKINAQYDYQDSIVEPPQLTPEQLKAMELERVRKALERASRCRDMPWPWVKRNWVIYRESNCFMVPSKYENKHKDKFAKLPAEKLVDQFFPIDKTNEPKNKNIEDNTKQLNGNLTDETSERDEEYEEVEEELEEEEEVEAEEDEIEKVEDEVIKQEEAETLEDKLNENHDNSLDKNDSNLEEISSEEIDLEKDTIDENDNENSNRKDSNQSASSYELDNNNNHVAKHKEEKNNKEISNSDTLSEDHIINEIAENSNEALEENLIKSDDDVIDSVLNEDQDSDLQNET